MVYPLLSYAQIRVSVLLSLGYRFSIAGLGSLGVALEVGRFGLSLPSRGSFICCWGFVPWFLSLLCGTNLDEPVFGLHIDLPCIVHCGAQSMPELGRSLVYWSLWYMLPSPLIWFSFIEYWARVWVSPPSYAGYRFLVWDASFVGCMQLVDLISSRSLSLYRLEVPLWITDSWLGFC